jgi:hypothetical protein
MEKFVINREGLYLANHPSQGHWTEDIAKAMEFDYMVIADATAIIDLGLSIEDYELETVVK